MILIIIIEKVYKNPLSPDALIALSDAIFAVVMTILILDIITPTISQLSNYTDYINYLSYLNTKIGMFILIFIILGSFG
ncbi:MAG: TMEM175 family protein [Methanobacteriaceae archaeon]|nr:TMEM175 family protein [Methanobacteriaceae archaeon]